MSEEQPSSLQFDRAEPVAPGAAASNCAICGQPLTDGYFTLNGNAVHGTCKDQVAGHFGGGGGSGIGRFFKASLFGFGAGLAGTVVWYIVEHALNLQIGLVAILIGWLAGTGVSKGSNGVGGLPYQLLAVWLTYVCICFAWVPDIAAEIGKPRTTVEAKADATGDSATDAAPTDAAPEGERKPMPAVIRYPIAMVVSLIAPFTGSLGAIGLLIAGFGLFEAWRKNKKVDLQIAGPFSLSGGPPPVPHPAGGVVNAGQ
jgi:hypothetical protein